MSMSESRLLRPSFHFERDFTLIPNAWLRDRRLSFKARGILAFLMSQPRDAAVTLGWLASMGRDGIDGVRTGVLELERCGYVERVPRIDHQGHDWLMRDPFDPVDNSVLSALDFPTRSQSTLEKPMGKSNDSKKTYKKTLKELPKVSTRAPLAACGHLLVDDRHCDRGCPPPGLVVAVDEELPPPLFEVGP